MSDIGVKQRCPLSPTLFGSYIDELVTYMLAILLYVDDVALLSEFGPSLLRLLINLYIFGTSSSLEVNLSKTKGKRHPT